MQRSVRRRFLQLALQLVGAGLSFLGQGSNAEVAGPTMNWAQSICEWRIGTDVLDDNVSACVKTLAKRDHIRPAPAEMCSVNRRYKTELCRAWIKDGTEKSLRVCLGSTESIPEEVSAGF
ncbi:MAG: hypothetical protein ACJ8G1_06625 [Vitreoscilla sp.]